MNDIIEVTAPADEEARALVYSMLLHPDLWLGQKAEAIAIAKRLQYAEHTAADKQFISAHLGVKL